MSEPITQQQLLMEYFTRNPNRDIKHPEIVDWAVREYRQRTGEVFRDPDRAIRLLHQSGVLMKVGKGVYRYDPDLVVRRELEDFSPEIKAAVLKRDGCRCVICGKGRKEGVDLHIDHIKPKDKGGKATLENGQTLCSQHNFFKKNYDQTEAGKRYFLRLLDAAIQNRDVRMVNFCADILNTYEKHGIDSHIKE